MVIPKGKALIRGPHLFEAQGLLEEIRYVLDTLLYCRFSHAENWELENRLWGQNLEEAMFVYILRRKISYDS